MANMSCVWHMSRVAHVPHIGQLDDDDDDGTYNDLTEGVGLDRRPIDVGAGWGHLS